MADYFTKFSIVIPLEDGQAAYAMTMYELCSNVHQEGESVEKIPVEAFRDEGFLDGLDWELEDQDGSLWIYGYLGGADSVAVFIQHLLNHFNIEQPVVIEWSNDCSKPRTDAYGGGAVIIRKDGADWMSTSQWVEDQLKLHGGGAINH